MRRKCMNSQFEFYSHQQKEYQNENGYQNNWIQNLSLERKKKNYLKEKLTCFFYQNNPFATIAIFLNCKTAAVCALVQLDRSRFTNYRLTVVTVIVAPSFLYMHKSLNHQLTISLEEIAIFHSNKDQYKCYRYLSLPSKHQHLFLHRCFTNNVNNNTSFFC